MVWFILVLTGVNGPFFTCLVWFILVLTGVNWPAQDCDAYANRGQYGLGTYTPKSTRGDSALTFLKNVQA